MCKNHESRAAFLIGLPFTVTRAVIESTSVNGIKAAKALGAMSARAWSITTVRGIDEPAPAWP